MKLPPRYAWLLRQRLADPRNGNAMVWLLVGSDADRLMLGFHNFDRPMGVAIDQSSNTMAVAARDRIWYLNDASGPGGETEFFLQQLRRMDVSLDEAAQWASIEQPHHVSGRCSVFCKSDCTHATNKGIPRSQVTAGLCKMMANKILELLKKVDRKNIMIAGGTALNRTMIKYLGNYW